MLSSSDLVEMAESFTLRIPNSPEYAEEREASWKHVGHGHLACGDVDGALRAVGRLPVGRPHADLLFAIAKWAEEHPESDTGLQVAGDLANRIGEWEPWFNRLEISQLALIVGRLLGEGAWRKFTDDLKDLFSRSNVLTAFAVQIEDVDKCRDLGDREGSRGIARDNLSSPAHK